MPALGTAPVSLTLCSYYLISAAQRRWDELVCVSHSKCLASLGRATGVQTGEEARAPTPTPLAQGAHELEHVAETPPAESLAASALQAKQPFLIVKCDPHGVRVQSLPAKPWTNATAEQ